MKTLQIDEKNARKLYKSASPEFKTTLEDTFGKGFFSTKITDRLNDYSDCLNETGLPDAKTVNEIPERFHQFILAVYKNIVIVEAYNEGETFDIFNENVKRHYPYFACAGSPSRFAFDDSYYCITDAHAGSGSRLCLKDLELSDDYGTKFKNEIIEMLTK